MAYWQHPTHPVEYNAWNAMKVRCRNPNHPYYHRYGGRGITVAPEWDSFPQFLADMGPRPSSQHSIERDDNDKGYSKDNCYWATRTEQSNNRNFNRLLTARGRTLTVGQWSTETGIPYTRLYQRIKAGWPEDLLFSKERLRRGRGPQPTRDSN